MGIFNSKVDVEAIETIEANVIGFIMKIGEEEGKIDHYVQQRISKALGVYSILIAKEDRKGYISKQKTLKMQDLILQAESKLKKRQTQKLEYKNTVHKTEYEMKTYLFEIDKRMKHNKIRENEFEEILKIVTLYAQKLEAGCRWSTTEEQQDNFSVLFLKLFLRCPSTKVANILQNNIQYLDNVIKIFELIDVKNVTAFNAEEVRSKLEEIKLKGEQITRITMKRLNELEQQPAEMMDTTKEQNKKLKSNEIASRSSTTWHKFDCERNVMMKTGNSNKPSVASKYEKILKQIEKDLNECVTIVEKICAPVGDAVVSTVKEKVFDLMKNRLKNIPDDVSITAKKKLLFEKGMNIVSKLDKIDDENKVICENLKALKEVEDEVSALSASNVSFQDKRSILGAAAKTVNQIDTDNNEVQIQKNEIENRIEGYLIAESLNYLRQLKKTVDHFKMYAQQFAFPKSINVYKMKREQIHFLVKHLDDLPKDRQCIDVRVQVIQQEIDRALEVLEEKVKHNEEVLNSLEFLDNLAKEVAFNNDRSLSPSIKLEVFNGIRRRIEGVHGFNHRLCTKKTQIMCQLHFLEEKIYSTNYPEEITEIKALLNEHEKDAQQFVHPITSEMYEQKRNEIHILLENTNKIMGKDYNSYVYANILKDNFKAVLELLGKTAKENKDNTERREWLMHTDNQITGFASSNVPVPKQLESLGQYESLVKIMKTNIQKIEVLIAAETTETNIKMEKFRIELTNLGDNLKQLKENVTHLTHPINSDTFKQKINEIFSLKEYVEDMPEGNPKLDSLKQSFLREISIILKNLDEQVAHLVVSRKRTENILELKNLFDDFNPGEVLRESLEFVQIIRERAKIFESCTKYYLGTNYSVDYYVIHENLMRLLEELDKISCDDNALLEATVEAMNYVKSLIEELDSNASND